MTWEQSVPRIFITLKVTYEFFNSLQGILKLVPKHKLPLEYLTKFSMFKKKTNKKRICKRKKTDKIP